MKRQVYLYGLILAGLLLVLKAVEYKYLVYDFSLELYLGLVALLCIVLGLWLGSKITSPPKKAVSGSTLAVADSRPSGPSRSDLGISVREQQVLRLIAAGHSNQEIADKLFLSLNTIKKHTSALFAKLEVQRRTQAMEKAKRLGLIE